MKEANVELNKASVGFQGSLSNAEVVAAMGMAADIRRRQDILFDGALEKQSAASRKAGMWAGVSKSYLNRIKNVTNMHLNAYIKQIRKYIRKYEKRLS